jgi:hypothetical protein
VAEAWSVGLEVVVVVLLLLPCSYL